jgi:outer membrane protein assembly factor BamB
VFKKKLLLLFSLVLILSLFLVSFAHADSKGNGVRVKAGTGWEQFQKDSLNSGQAESPAPTANITQGWRQQVQVDNPQGPMAGVNVTPLIAENKVFILDARGGMWAFEAKTGVQLWKTNLSCTGMKFQLATPAYAEGKLFVATNDGHVYALEAKSGNIIWDKVIAGKSDQLNTPVKYADGKVYVGALKNKTYYCLDALSGEVLWQRPSTTGGGYYWAGACVVGNYLVFGDESAVLTSVYKDSGELVDEKSLPVITKEARKIHSSITYNLQTNKVFFTDEGGHCWAYNFNPQTGQLTYAWHKKIGRVSTSTPAIFKGKVYVGSGTYVFQGYLYCFEEATGKELWKFTPPDDGENSKPGIQSSPSLSLQEGKVYLYFITIYENATVYCLDENGNKLWSFTSQEAGTSGGYTTSSLAIADGWAYFGNDGGWVYALTGKVAGQQKQQPPAEEVAVSPPPAFSDLPANHWASEVISEMTAKGIFQGYPDGTCRPDKVVTRAEFVSLLLRTLKLKEEKKTVDFSDVQPGNWYYRTVATAYHYGLVKGYAEAEQRFKGQTKKKQYFRPHEPVTREQVAVMLIRALEHKGLEKNDLGKTKVEEILARFNDQGKISAWAKEAVSRAITQEIIRGYPGNLFKPQTGATRAECAAMLRKIVKE